MHGENPPTQKHTTHTHSPLARLMSNENWETKPPCRCFETGLSRDICCRWGEWLQTGWNYSPHQESFAKFLFYLLIVVEEKMFWQSRHCHRNLFSIAFFEEDALGWVQMYLLALQWRKRNTKNDLFLGFCWWGRGKNHKFCLPFTHMLLLPWIVVLKCCNPLLFWKAKRAAPSWSFQADWTTKI